MSNWIRRGNYYLRRSNATRRDRRTLVMGFLRWLFMGPTERTLGGVPPSDSGAPYIVEVQQAQVMDSLSHIDREDITGWTGPNHDVPIFQHGCLSDIWADQRKGKQ